MNKTKNLLLLSTVLHKSPSFAPNTCPRTTLPLVKLSPHLFKDPCLSKLADVTVIFTGINFLCSDVYSEFKEKLGSSISD